MPFSLIPDRVAACYAEITPDYLKERGITLLLSDLDFTLAANRAGVGALRVEPVGGAVAAWQKVLHALQAPFKAACRRRTGKKG